jgi:hypothetical protein
MNLDKKKINNYPLSKLTLEEKAVLYKMFNITPNDASNENLSKKLSKLILPVTGILQSGISYEEMIGKVAKNANIDFETGTTVFQKEQALYLELFKASYNDMNAVEKEEFLMDLEKKGLSKDQVASVATIATLGAAQLSGFGIYLLASSTVGAITSALGITLSFGFYTTMSSIISYAIGPVGFAIAAIPLYRSFRKVRNIEDLKNKLKKIYTDGNSFIKGNYKGAEIVIQYFASLRIMKLRELEQKLTEKKEEESQNINYLRDLDNELYQINLERNKISKEIKEIELKLNTLKSDLSDLEDKKRGKEMKGISLDQARKAALHDVEIIKKEIANLKK